MYGDRLNKVSESCEDFGFSSEYGSEAVAGFGHTIMANLPLKRVTLHTMLKIC